ncbi:MAG: 2-dehydropantoate 2-reductase [bacterium]
MASGSELRAKRVLVAGAGAIGGITGGHMSRKVPGVLLYDRNKEHVARINERGLLVGGCRGRVRFRVKAVDNLKEIEWEPDYVFIAVKSALTRLLMEELAPRMGEKCVVVSLQNGINEYLISEYVGKSRVFGIVTGWGATNKGAGALTQTSRGEFIVGALSGGRSAELREVKKLLGYCAPTKISSNIMGAKYGKLMMNGIINTLGAMTGVTLGEFISDPRGAIAFIKMWNEEAAILRSINIKLESFDPYLKENTFQSRNGVEFLLALVVLYFVRRNAGGLTSSMLQDIRKGVRSENKYLPGHFLDINERGVAAPFIQKAYNMVEEIEDGKRDISMRNLDELLSVGEVNPRWGKLFKWSALKLPK